MRVAVAGAGIGGLALALALRARGAEVVLCERELRLAEVGAGVQLGPNAVKVLDRLGVGDAARAAAFRPEAAEVREAAGGRRLLRVELGAAAVERWGAPFLQLHRADLQALLLRAVQAAGAEVRLGAAACAAEPGGALRLDDGGRVEADAVVGADGLRSPAAASLWGAETLRRTGLAAWRAVVARSDVAAPVPPVAMVWTGAGRHLVHYPVRGGREVNLVGVARLEREAGAGGEGWSEGGAAADLRAAFADWPQPVADLVGGAGAVWRQALYDRPPRARWSRGRATLMGDAAHPMLPFLAQGAATAIEDAWVLARELDGAGAGGVAAALERYEAARRPRTAKVQAWSRRNGRLYHLPSPLARSVFGAAAALDGPQGAAARLDWLYGWDPG